jgi:hypothetical protein
MARLALAGSGANSALGAKLDAICGKIKNEDERREAMSLARMFLSARENAQRCAVDCAPYVHARLQAVHHEHGPTGRYIIADRPMTEPEWIAARADVIDSVTCHEFRNVSRDHVSNALLRQACLHKRGLG